MGRAPGNERVYDELNRLLQNNELKPFVEAHSEFAWESNGQNGMIIKFA